MRGVESEGERERRGSSMAGGWEMEGCWGWRRRWWVGTGASGVRVGEGCFALRARVRSRIRRNISYEGIEEGRREFGFVWFGRWIGGVSG